MLKKLPQKKTEPAVLCGWFEILFYFGAESTLRGVDYINMRQYMLVHAALPIDEFFGPYDLYESMFRGTEIDNHIQLMELEPSEQEFRFGLPRMFAEYDIINAIVYNKKSKKQKSISMLLIDEKKNTHLIPPKTQLQYRPGRELAGLLLTQNIPSRKHELIRP